MPAHHNISIEASRPQPYCSEGNTISAAREASNSRLTVRNV